MIEYSQAKMYTTYYQIYKDRIITVSLPPFNSPTINWKGESINKDLPLFETLEEATEHLIPLTKEELGL